MNTNRVVCRHRDGSIEKGTTHDFLPTRETFHLETPGGGSRLVDRRGLKAVFFVRSFDGDPSHIEEFLFDDVRGPGRRLYVTFEDGEILAGTATAYSPDKPGFFLFPIDPNTNNERIYVVRESVLRVREVAAA
jgi:hypothetical protein